MLIPKHLALSNFDEPNPHLQELFTIFSATLNPALSYREFRFFYFRHKPHYMDISFLQDDGKTVGFICVTFYRHQLGNRQYTICRGAAGIHEDYRGGKLPNGLLCWKYIQYKLRHPMEEMVITGYMANPILYSMICKYTHKVYPKAGIAVPAHIHELRDKLINYYGLQKKVVAPFVLKIHFQVHMNNRDEQRIFSASDRDIRFYLALNPDFQRQIGVMTLVPVTWYNVFVSISRFVMVRPLRKFTTKHVVTPLAAWKRRWWPVPAGKRLMER
jgi:hypothetical protein